MAFTDEQNEQIRKDLIREARRCGITIGMRKTSVEQLTNSVGISKGSFYKFFDSKELLFFAVLEDGRNMLFLTFAAVFAKQKGVTDILFIRSGSFL